MIAPGYQQAPVGQHIIPLNPQISNNDPTNIRHQVVIYPSTPHEGALWDKSKICQAKFIGFSLIIIGILCIIFNAISIGLDPPDPLYGSNLDAIAYGIWGGILMSVAGILGLSATNGNSKCRIISFMVLCIIASLAALVIVIVGGWSSAMAADCGYFEACGGGNKGGILAMNILMCITAGIGGALCIWGSVLGCNTVCCCAYRNEMFVRTSQPVYHYPSSAQKSIVYVNGPTTAPHLQANLGWYEQNPYAATRY